MSLITRGLGITGTSSGGEYPVITEVYNINSKILDVSNITAKINTDDEIFSKSVDYVKIKADIKEDKQIVGAVNNEFTINARKR